jgi:hypothetical protein
LCLADKDLLIFAIIQFGGSELSKVLDNAASDRIFLMEVKNVYAQLSLSK